MKKHLAKIGQKWIGECMSPQIYVKILIFKVMALKSEAFEVIRSLGQNSYI